jgi:Flp pilus assembly protein TadB
MEEAFVEVAKNNFVLAVFVALIVIIGLLVYYLFAAKMRQVDAKIEAMEIDVKSIKDNVHKIGTSVNSAMASVQSDIKEVNMSVKFMAIKLGKDPMEFIDDKKH